MTPAALANYFFESKPLVAHALSVCTNQLSDIQLAVRVHRALPTSNTDPTPFDMADPDDVEWAVEIICARIRASSLSPTGSAPHIHPNHETASRIAWWLTLITLALAIWIPLLWILGLIISH